MIWSGSGSPEAVVTTLGTLGSGTGIGAFVFAPATGVPGNGRTPGGGGALVAARGAPGIVTVVGGGRCWGTVRIARFVTGAETRGAGPGAAFVFVVRVAAAAGATAPVALLVAGLGVAGAMTFVAGPWA